MMLALSPKPRPVSEDSDCYVVSSVCMGVGGG